MSRVCDLTGVRVQAGNNVSHSERKTRRRFLPNLHKVTIASDKLGRKFKFRVVPQALRTIEMRGGLDRFLLNSKPEHLSKSALYVRNILKKLEA